MIPAFEHHPNSRFLGFPMSQNRYAIPAWSYLLEQVKPSSIIEIGTFEGGMSCLFALAARQLGATFDTFDVGQTINSLTATTLSLLAGPNNGFHCLDVFSAAGETMVKKLIRYAGLSIVLCDGGNKGHEFCTFATFLKPGDIIGVHDARGRESWPWQEFHPEKVAEFMAEQGLQEFMGDVFLETGWFVCRKRSDSQSS